MHPLEAAARGARENRDRRFTDTFSPRLLILLCLIVLLTSNCTWFRQWTGSDDSVLKQPPGAYMDFEDVHTPPSMELDRDSSFVYESESIKAGVLALRGREDMNKVISYFQNQMPQDGWEILTSFKYQKNVLIYTKRGKVCLITAEHPRGMSDTYVEVWVAPIKNGKPGFSSIVEGLPAFGPDQPPQQENISE